MPCNWHGKESHPHPTRIQAFVYVGSNMNSELYSDVRLTSGEDFVANQESSCVIKLLELIYNPSKGRELSLIPVWGVLFMIFSLCLSQLCEIRFTWLICVEKVSKSTNK
jgi:hypothetical protein